VKRADRNGEEAQALIEFALFATVLLYFFLGTVDFGRFLYYDNAIRSAARVGAEVASNHCPYAKSSCGASGTVTVDNYVIWSTYCEAATYVDLNLGQYSIGQANTKSTGAAGYTQATGMISQCNPNDTTSNASTWAPTCATGASCASCTTDICVAPASRISSTPLSVSVGYDFKPITPLMNQFFPVQQCWSTSDSPVPPVTDPASNQHTICTKSVGQVY
jgi:Flp pilus assembly protein TadG